ncbi:class I SAM-dependent methyltransferase [Actinomycetospora straminea]|uniref:Class I SAM-dependent methyltransferase n=1 Tax=Actinomycetospora straminea TaxID=663607 RepID=A0ABP9F8U4_9PSEU|nr:class I SAM-dependent methyltransferase [Actinomycetospora straminea]MDD7936683.1 class I SAM-dependent methyltransferase [Actinomycetospora straminea]
MTGTSWAPTGAVTPSTGGAFDAALTGRAHRLVRADGVVVALDPDRWHGEADPEDHWLVDRCAGPTLDLGCGPGRLLVALATRGVPALGVDVSPEAIRYCEARGATVLHRDALDGLPGPGRWAHVLLADGNIGIGGDPVGLLQRCRTLLRPLGTVLVELEPTAGSWWQGVAHLDTDTDTDTDTHTDDLAPFDGDVPPPTRCGPWFPWAVLGASAIDAVAARAGLEVTARRDGTRCFAELSVAGTRPATRQEA